jgi:hypothetical protein
MRQSGTAAKQVKGPEEEKQQGKGASRKGQRIPDLVDRERLLAAKKRTLSFLT